MFTPPRWCTDLSCCGMCVADGALQALLFGGRSRRPMSAQACRPPRQDAWLIPDPLLPYVPPALRLRSSCVASNSPLPPSNPCGLRVDLRGQVACGCRETVRLVEEVDIHSSLYFFRVPAGVYNRRCSGWRLCSTSRATNARVPNITEFTRIP